LENVGNSIFIFGVKTELSGFITGSLASAAVSLIFVFVANPLGHPEAITLTSKIDGKSIGVVQACKEVMRDSKAFGLLGIFRGQDIGISKAVLSLTFHQGCILIADMLT